MFVRNLKSIWVNSDLTFSLFLKSLAGPNTLAYSASLTETKKNVLYC